MQKWEHKITEGDPCGEDGMTDIEKRLNKLGQEGWELVTVAPHGSGEDTRWHKFYFKRPLDRS